MMHLNPVDFHSFDNHSKLSISWKAIVHNISYFRNLLNPSCKIMLMVKADAYGYEGSIVSKRIAEEKLADYFGVASIEEGIELRKIGIQLPIMVQNPSFSDWDQLLAYELEPTIQNIEGLHSLGKHLSSSQANDESCNIHLEFNTGMNRFGFKLEDINEVYKELQKNEKWKVSSIMSHLSSSGNQDEESFTLSQLQQFAKIKESLQKQLPNEVIYHILNTDGINNYPNHQLDMVRFGIGIYGASGNDFLKTQLKPAARLSTKVVGIRRVKKGESISYNRSGTAENDMQIAVLSIGYADGFLRKLGNGNWKIEINGKLYPTIGDICMDLCMLQLDEDSVKVGDEAILFGGQKSLFDYAEALDTITYEAITLLGNRVIRELRD